MTNDALLSHTRPQNGGGGGGGRRFFKMGHLFEKGLLQWRLFEEGGAYSKGELIQAGRTNSKIYGSCQFIVLFGTEASNNI